MAGRERHVVITVRSLFMGDIFYCINAYRHDPVGQGIDPGAVAENYVLREYRQNLTHIRQPRAPTEDNYRSLRYCADVDPRSYILYFH